MKLVHKYRRFFIIGILLFFLLGILLGFYIFKENKNNHALVLYGNIDIRQVDLGFRVMGLVKEMPFEEGDLVHEGDVIGVLDNQPYLDQVNEANANVSSAQASLIYAEKVLKRREELVKDGSVSQEDLEEAEQNYEMLRANLLQTKAALAVAKTNLSFTTIYAPTSGTILSRVREPGAVVNVAEPIYTLSILSPVWVRAYVTEPELGLIYPGMSAEIYTDTKDSKIYKGRIGFISPVAEFTPKTVQTTALRVDLTYRIRIYVDNPDYELKQGMPITVKLPLNPGTT